MAHTPTSERGPSPFAMERAFSELMQARDALIAIDPDAINDERLFVDFLEAEAGDALAILDRVLHAAVAAKAQAEMAEQRIAEIQTRRDRFRRREQAWRAAAFAAMEALEMRKYMSADLDASIAAPGQPSTVVIDETQIPKRFMRVVETPDKTAIKAAIQSGDEVPGAAMSNPRPSLRIRGA